MKTITKYITEEQETVQVSNESKLGKKIDSVFAKNKNMLAKIIQSRQDHWDSNLNEWSREPMFLIAEPIGKLENSAEKGTPRDFSWVRWKFMRGKQGEVQGTFRNYNIANDEGSKPNSVIGIYYDRHFEIISSLQVFQAICDVMEKNYEKYYNNLYESEEE